MEDFEQFHDGFLDGLWIQGTTALVFLSTLDKQEFVLRVSGVWSLKMDEFREGNIIFDALKRQGAEVTVADMMDFYGFKDTEEAQRKLDEVHRKNLLVLEVNPSYGAICSVLAESAVLLPRPLTNLF